MAKQPSLVSVRRTRLLFARPQHASSGTGCTARPPLCKCASSQVTSSVVRAPRGMPRQAISPYHRIPAAAAASGKLPAVLFTTSTRDDRVHPAHARKMVSRLQQAAAGGPGAERIFYYENMEGGHGGAADSQQRAFVSTTIYSFLYKTIASVR